MLIHVARATCSITFTSVSYIQPPILHHHAPRVPDQKQAEDFHGQHASESGQDSWSCEGFETKLFPKFCDGCVRALVLELFLNRHSTFGNQLFNK